VLTQTQSAVPGDDLKLQRFGSDEHRLLGDAASGGAAADLDIGDPQNPLTHGDLVALSGDYFSSPAEIMRLAGTEAGRAEIRWARFDSMHRGNPGVISDVTKKAVKDRYYRLAAGNISHFSAGVLGWCNRGRGDVPAFRGHRGVQRASPH
jgi:hypothetical protein